MFNKKNKTEFGFNMKNEDHGQWFDLMSYWILGLCNNTGFVVMLSAAHDINHRHSLLNVVSTSIDTRNDRMCSEMLTGVILLANIIPSLIIRILSIFSPFDINVRVFVACATQYVGFILVALAEIYWVTILGVVLTSFSSGLGEASFLSYSPKFHRNVISSWSSGTTAAGVFGSLSYAALTKFLGILPRNIMLLMLMIPLLESIVFWNLLRDPNESSNDDSVIEPISDTKTSPDVERRVDVEMSNTKTKNTIHNNIHSISQLFEYMAPLTLVYIFSYFINQGLLEFIYFDNIWLNREVQYRWLQVLYQIGVFISCLLVYLIKIKQIWLMSLFQFIILIIILTEVITFFSPSIWIVFGFVLCEGMISGGAFVNTVYRMSQEIPDNQRTLALEFASISFSIGITLAGVFAIPAHNIICKMPMPTRR